MENLKKYRGNSKFRSHSTRFPDRFAFIHDLITLSYSILVIRKGKIVDSYCPVLRYVSIN